MTARDNGHIRVNCHPKPVDGVGAGVEPERLEPLIYGGLGVHFGRVAGITDHLGRLLIIKLLVRLSGLDVVQLSKCLNGLRLGFPGNVTNWEFGWVLKFDFVF